jgi:hypothetical protein
VASADLGGLGSKEGTPVAYTWAPSNVLPYVLPWLAVLLLLLLKRNRCAQAWWVWLPLLGVTALQLGLRPVFDFVPSNPLEAMGDLITALAFGFTAVWLVSPYLGHKPRILAFLGILATCGIFGAAVYAVRSEWGENSLEAVGFLAFLAFSALLLALAITLASLMCRHRYGPLRFLLWLIGWLVAGWLVVASPFFLFALASGAASDAPVLGLLSGILALASGTFLIVLPFLLLAFANTFYRERFLELLQLPGAQPPAVIAPALQ